MEVLDQAIEQHRRMITEEATRLARLRNRLKVLGDLRASRRPNDLEISKFLADPVTSFLRYLMPVTPSVTFHVGRRLCSLLSSLYMYCFEA